MNIIEKVKEKIGIRPKEKSADMAQLEMVRKSLVDSLSSRPFKEDGTEMDMSYISDLITDIERLDKLIKEQKEKEKKFHFHLPKMDGHVLASFISGCAAVTVAIISRDFGRECIEYDNEGKVVPTRLFNLGPKIPTPKT
jgi:hypothetical protein